MRSFWLWLACLIVYSGAQKLGHYGPPQELPPVHEPPPICDAGSYIVASCVNHHITVGLTASNSQHFTSVEWSVNHPGVSLSSSTSVTPLLKVDPGHAMCNEKVRITLIVKGKNGKSDKCDVEVGMTDFQRPVFTFNPKDEIVDCDDIPVPAYVGAKDDCDKHVDVTFTETENTNHGQTTINRKWVAEDSCGNRNEVSQLVTVQDKQAPNLVGVGDHTTVECDNIPQPCAVVSYDNCEEYNEVDFTEKTLTGTCVDSYIIVRTWSASDAAYNSNSESQTITVVDTTPPIITGGGGHHEVEHDHEEHDYPCDAVPDIEDHAISAVDNCDDDVKIHPHEEKEPTTCPHEYHLHRTWDAVDDCGNTDSIEIELHITPQEPTITEVEEHITIFCNDDLPICEPDFDDPCDYGIDLVYTESSVPGTCIDEYTIYREWSITNVCGLSYSQTQTVTVQDGGPPKFTSHPPAMKTVSCDHIPIYDFNAVDDCDMDVYILADQTDTRGDKYVVANYEIIRVWIATDNFGNTANLHQTIVVSDTTPPQLFGGPPHMTVECDAVSNGTAYTLILIDECDCPEVHMQIHFEETREDGTCEDEYRLIRKWWATDCSSNYVEYIQTVQVQDTLAPHLIAKEGHEFIPIEDFTREYWAHATATDNCDCVTVEQDNIETVPGTCNHHFHVIHTATATDCCGNTASKSYTITVDDKTPPIFIDLPSGYMTWMCDDPRLGDYNANEILNGEIASVTDNSQNGQNEYDEVEIFFKKVVIPGTCDDQYDFLLTWTATDSCNNKQESEVKISVIDWEAPTISKPEPKIITDDCNIPSPEGLVTASDNCAEVTVLYLESVSYDLSECDSQFIVYREWSVVDDCGNQAGPVKQTVWVMDNEGPIWIVPAPEDKTYECDNLEDYSIAPVAIDPNCHDNTTHSDVTLTETVIDYECEHAYKVRRKWTAKDCNGNFQFAIQTITVIDDTPPVFTTHVEDETVHCSHDDPPIVTAIDNCGYAVHVKFFETTESDCPHDYVLRRRWVAEDDCGNKATLYQNVFVEDREAPVIVGPSDCVASCDEELSPGDAVCTDDCTYATMTHTTVRIDNDCPHNYEVVRTWHCEDACGKSDYHIQTVKVSDLDAPVFDSYHPPDITAECNYIPEPPFSIGGSDNCGYPLTGLIEVKRTDIYGAKANRYELIRTWILRDTCGNSVLCDQTIHVDDTTPPVLHNIPADISVPCDEVHYWDNVWASDNCDWWIDITSSIERVNTTCEHRYTLVRTWVAEDDCGNTATGTQTIVVDDHEKPEFRPFTPSYHYTTPNKYSDDEETNIPDPILVNYNNIDSILPKPTAVDNCDLYVPVSCTTTKEPGCTEDDYTLTRICTCEDECGNQGYPITQIVEVEDRTPCPFLTIPADTTVECDVELADIYTRPTHNCHYMAFAESMIPQTCQDNMLVIKSWTITDECGNSKTAQQTITIEDTQPPIMEYLPDVEEECAVDIESYMMMTDNCDHLPSQIYKEVQVYYRCAHDYQVIQQWLVRDRCGKPLQGTNNYGTRYSASNCWKHSRRYRG